MATHIDLRRDTAANWLAANPVMDLGEAGVESDTRRIKVGDGSTPWSGLPYSTLTPADAQATYETQAHAASTYLPAATAASTYLTQTSAASTYQTQSGAAATFQTSAGLDGAVAAFVGSAGQSGTALDNRFKNSINVRSYGAKGDGVTDDTTAIQNAINAAQGVNGLFLPAGTYMVSAPLVVSGRLWMVGCGDATILKASATITAVLQVTHTSGSNRGSFEDFKVDGGGKATNCIQESIATETSVGTRWVRVKWTASTDFGYVNTGCEDVTLLDCANDGNESQPNTTTHCMSVTIPGGLIRILGGEFFGRCLFDAQQVLASGAVIGPIKMKNSTSDTTRMFSAVGCYIYDGGVDGGGTGEQCLSSTDSLFSAHFSDCIFVQQSQATTINGNLPALHEIRLTSCIIWQAPGLPANPTTNILNCSGAGRLIIDGGVAKTLTGGTVNYFNAVSSATTDVIVVAPMTNATVPTPSLVAGAQSASVSVGFGGVTDRAGEVQMTALATGMAAGALVTVNFKYPLQNNPRAVIICDESAASVGLYVNSKSKTGFQVSSRSAATASQALQFTYQVIMA